MLKNVKNSIVKIQLTSKNDIRINWNFNGLLMPKIFRRHVFVCASSSDQIAKSTVEIMEKCYQFFKNGDLYAFVSQNNSQLEWHQKSKVGKIQIPQFHSKNSLKNRKTDFRNLTQIFCNLIKFRQPCLVLISIDEEDSYTQIQSYITELRDKNLLNCVVMISSAKNKQNCIQFSKGICYLGPQKHQVAAFYKYYDEHLACLQADITLQSLSGNLFMNSDIWKPLQFSMFKRKLYYPIAKYLCDVISTYRLCSGNAKTWKFRIVLNYKLLNGQMYTACKQIEVPLITDIQKSVTSYKIEEKNKKYQLSWGIELGCNPLEKYFFLQPGI